MSSYTIVVTKSAAKDISKLGPPIKKRIKKKLEFFITQKDPLKYAKSMAGPKYGSYRWRIGDYRVVFDVDDHKIVILQVQHRRDIYRK